ncbi:hypothetical protein RB595_009907 [Gaeumannomyces hyphopodioides]
MHPTSFVVCQRARYLPERLACNELKQHQQPLDQLNHSDLNGHATPNTSIYYNQHNSDLFSSVDNLDLDLSGYDAALDADSPPSVTRNTDDGMHDAWLSQQTKPAGRYSHQFSHNRDSSLGSLSASGTVSGPASPASPAFTNYTSTPQIAVTDDGHSMAAHGAVGDYYQLAKPFGSGHGAFYPGYPTYQHQPDPSAGATQYSHLLAAQLSKPRNSQPGLLPPPELSASSRSRPVSVASSVVSADSPATPAPGEPEERRSKNVGLSSVPKFERTITDVFNDELFHPANFTMEASSPSQAQSPPQAASPTSELFARRLQAANSQHMSPITGDMSRDRSPFRNGSPLAPTPLHDFGTTAQQQPQQQPQQQQPQQQQQQQQRPMGFNSAQQMREHVKAERDAEAMRQQMQGSIHARATPVTVSPKDVALEFPEAESDVHNFPLFPQPSASTSGFSAAAEEQISKAVAAIGSGIPLEFYSQIPQQYPFVAVGQVPMQQQHDTGSMTPMRQDLARAASSAPSQTSSSIGQQQQQQQHSHSHSPMVNNPQRPANTRADGGTYSCTYHGCTLRFETPALLQKHKREGHRQGLGANGRKPDGDGAMVGQGLTSSLLNTQQGPHRCDRINPSTNKPCATIFSRPYDLTRHEDTIHNGRKQKVRCQICTGEEKTFSRADALTRHYRVVHPDLEVPGKHRRKAMANLHH